MRLSCAVPPLNTGRLLLRPFVPADAAAVFAGWAGDAEALRFQQWGPLGESETAAMVRRWCFAYEEEPDFALWALARHADGALLGQLGFAADADGMLSPGLTLDRRFWRQGYGGEALLAGLRFFAAAGTGRFSACCARQNAAGQALLQKAGFVPCGTAWKTSFDGSRRFLCTLLFRTAAGLTAPPDANR